MKFIRIFLNKFYCTYRKDILMRSMSFSLWFCGCY